jgi:chromosome segregation ATPase
MNYNTPDSWDESRERYETERKKNMNEIQVGERTVAEFEPAGQECVKKLTELIARKNKLEAEIVELTEKILPLNDLISDEPEHHPVTFMKVAETDGTNPEEHLSQY